MIQTAIQTNKLKNLINKKQQTRRKTMKARLTNSKRYLKTASLKRSG